MPLRGSTGVHSAFAKSASSRFQKRGSKPSYGRAFAVIARNSGIPALENLNCSSEAKTLAWLCTGFEVGIYDYLRSVRQGKRLSAKRN
jgi:hypothetical protein